MGEESGHREWRGHERNGVSPMQEFGHRVTQGSPAQSELEGISFNIFGLPADLPTHGLSQLGGKVIEIHIRSVSHGS